jgi:hypothetical protein
MSIATPNPPMTPARPTALATQNGAIDIHRKFKESSSQVDLNESKKLSETLAIREAPDKIQVPATQAPAVIEEPPAIQSPMPNQDQHDAEPATINNERATSPQTPEPFDWDDLQARYDQAMAKEKKTEESLLNEFHELANASSFSIS